MGTLSYRSFIITKQGDRAGQGLIQKGFILLELLVALAIFAILSVIAYGGLRSVLYTQANVEAQTQRLAQVQMAFHFLERDIEQIVPRGIRDEFGQAHPALQSGGLNDELITLTRAGWDNPLGQQRANLERLAYRLREERLLRLHWNTLDRGGPGEPQQTVVLDRVKEVKVRFLDKEDKWQTSWPPTSQPTVQDQQFKQELLPRAVEISVTLQDWGEITRLFPLIG